MPDRISLGEYREFQLTAYPRDQRGYIAYAVPDLRHYAEIPREAVALVATCPTFGACEVEIRRRVDAWWLEVEGETAPPPDPTP